jgi:tRNA A-37 threonylcarbamoyl transferase component Bud32
MPSDLCPYCGKAAHGSESNFDCPGRSDLKTVVTGAPAFTPPVDGHLETPSPTVGAFGPFDTRISTKLTAGTRVGEYQIVDRIGEGGMGTVYSAVHPIIGKRVAIKVLAGRLANNKNAIRRFVLEARAVNDIRHPGLVDIFSFGQLTDGRHYYVMEFLAGRNLGDVLRERSRLSMAEAIPIFREVGQTLVAVHAKGIVHRDLKPENILLLATPQPGGQKTKLVDFGLAKLVEGVPTHLSAGGPRTAAGVNVGTPHYMSPEQCRGLKVDARADLYSLGILLYETLTGILPFDGATPLDIWQAHVEKPPRPPSQICPGAISPAMNEIILHLLAKQPEHRIQNASDFCAALQRLGEDGHAKVVASPDVTADMRKLALALGGQQAADDLVALDVATGGATTVPPARRRPEAYDEMATTTKDLPVVEMPEVAFSEEDRRKEIEELRASLGLHIDEPASDSQEEAQMSALAIDLAPGRRRTPEPADRQKSGRVPVAPAVTPKVRPGMRPVEERNRLLAPPAAPSARGGARNVASEGPVKSRPGRALSVTLVVVLLLAATAVAVMLVR